MSDVLDISPLVAPESDELVGDDLLGGPKTITITDVDDKGAEKKKVRLFYPGGKDRPWRPCKGMARVLMSQWGPDAKKWIGKTVKLFRDPDAMFGGAKVGGVRIAGMSHIPASFEAPVKERRGAVKVYRIEKLEAEPEKDTLAEAVGKIIANIARAPDATKLDAYLAGNASAAISDARANRPDLAAKLDAALSKKRSEWDDDDPFAQEGGASGREDEEAPPPSNTDWKGRIDACETLADLGKVEAEYMKADETDPVVVQAIDDMRTALKRKGEE